jgi:putative ABC transport system permease protein
MATPLAWHNLLHNRVRSGVAIAGVTFAIVLMFMQLGFLEAVKISATLIYDVLDFDICLRSRDYNRFTDARTFPMQRLNQAESVAGVASAAPLMVGIFSWRNPYNGEQRAVLAIGAPTDSPVYRDETQALIEQRLSRPETLLVDTRTRREFGPKNGLRFGPADEGVEVEINSHALTIAGDFTRGAGLSAGGAVLLSRHEFLRCAPYLTADDVNLGLLRVDPGQNVAALVQELADALPDDVETVSRQGALDWEVHHWVWETNFGLIFQSGVLVAVIVGTAIVYQVLASDVARLMPEYATLKAMGYGNWYLVGVMVQQALLLAIVSYILGVVVAQMLYVVTAAGAQIPVRMTMENLLLVFSLSVTMGVISGLAAVRKAFRADPAELFK